eukprot:5438431-Alexandrium_andersonii.AAC.1
MSPVYFRFSTIVGLAAVVLSRSSSRRRPAFRGERWPRRSRIFATSARAAFGSSATGVALAWCA